MAQYSQDPIANAGYAIGFNLLGGRKRAAKFADEEAEKELRRQARMEELKAAVDARYRMELERYVQEQLGKRQKASEDRQDYRFHAARGDRLEEQRMQDEAAMARTQAEIKARQDAAKAEREDPLYMYSAITKGLGPIGSVLQTGLADKDFEAGLMKLGKNALGTAGISYDEPAGPTATKAPARIPMSSVTKPGETPANGQAQPPLPVTPAPKPPSNETSIDRAIAAEVLRRQREQLNKVTPTIR